MLSRTRNLIRAATVRPARAGVRAGALVAGLALGLVLTGCGPAGEARPEKIELTVALFTDFGYQELRSSATMTSSGAYVCAARCSRRSGRVRA